MKTLIWDIPTRVFHWGFAASITAAFVLALGVDDDHPLFQLHMLFGLVAVSLLVLRLLLGLFGSRHARFRALPLKPLEITRYFLGVVSGRAKTYAGNNPGSALAAVAMFVLVPVVVFTGIGAGGEALEEVHRVAAYALLAIIAAHLLGLALHTLRHRENIAGSMITGRKIAPPEEGLRSAHPVWGLAFAGAVVAWTIALFANHDGTAGSVRLPLTGTVIQLGENEGREDRAVGEHGDRHGGRHRDDDDD